LQAAERAENNPNMPFLHSRGSRNMDAVRLLRHFQNAISSLFSAGYALQSLSGRDELAWSEEYVQITTTPPIPLDSRGQAGWSPCVPLASC